MNSETQFTDQPDRKNNLNNKSGVNRFRTAQDQDYRAIYDMQNIAFRSRVFANVLPPFERFTQDTKLEVGAGRMKYYILEQDGIMTGFTQYTIHPDQIADVVVWGKWVNTLMYISIKTAFDELGLKAVRSQVRVDNKRVMKTYQRLGIRSTGRELTPVRMGGILSPITMVGFQYYEMTREEFQVKADELRGQSLSIAED